MTLSPYPADLGLLSPQTADTDAALETIDFDDVTSHTFRKIPSGHAGLAWRNLNAMACDYTKDSQGYVNGNVSGDHVVYRPNSAQYGNACSPVDETLLVNGLGRPGPDALKFGASRSGCAEIIAVSDSRRRFPL
ncbi:hypothetical protein [Mesorhizobium sp. M0496]|uniref:hypothetical protein n=1 Tax=Mesorhizobium sp. M0496 TaxID=2956952 RepID=UPI003339327C